MPFSKLPKVRQLKKTLATTQKELDSLRRTMRNTGSESQEPFLTSPERAAVALLTAVDSSPRPGRIKVLLPFTETVSNLRKASSKIKKALFNEKPVNRLSTKNALSKTVKLSRDDIHKKRRRQSMRAAFARSRRALVADFLKQPQNSYELPSKKAQVRGSGTFGLTDTLHNLYRKFCAQYPEVRISRAVFCRARPPHIRLINYTQRRQCVCHRHANIALMVEAIKELPKSPDLLISMTDSDIKEKLEMVESSHIVFRGWQQCEVEHNGKVYKKTKIIQMTMPTNRFRCQFLASMPEFRAHCLRVTTQYQQLRILNN